MDHEDKPIPPLSESGYRDPGAWEERTRRLVTAVDADNVCANGCAIRVKLWTEWAQMLNTLGGVGEVLAITGNDCAVLGHTRSYPELEFCQSLRHAHSTDGAFDFEFVPWVAGYAVMKSCGGTDRWMVEFRDVANAVIHKICITERSQFGPFAEWVQYHQAVPQPPPPAHPVPPARWRTVQQRHWFDYDEVEHARPDAAVALLKAAMEEGVPVGVVVGNEGVVQSADFIPRRLQPYDSWMFISDDVVGLHLDAAALHDTIVHQASGGNEGHAFPTLKCFDEYGNLRLAITPPSYGVSAIWSDFLKSTVLS